ncbi:MAG: MFS transporter [Bacillota bacterium]
MNALNFQNTVVFRKLQQIYFLSEPQNEQDYIRSQKQYAYAECGSFTVMQFACNTFAAALLITLGFSDAQIGLVFSIANLTCIVQIFTMQRVEKMQRKKPFVCVTSLVKILFGAVFLLPFLHWGESTKQFLVVAFFVIAYTGTQISVAASWDWITDLVPTNIRGYYFAKKDAMTVAVSMVITLILGYLMDRHVGDGVNPTYFLIGVVGIMLALINFFSLSKMNEKQKVREVTPEEIIEKEVIEKRNFVEEVRLVFTDNKFKKQFGLNMLWAISFNFSSPYNSSFQIKELGLPFMYLTVLNFFGGAFRIFLSPKMGRIADKLGMAIVLKWALMGILVNQVFLSFGNAGNAYWVTSLGCVGAAFGWSFLGTGLFALQILLLDKEKRVMQLSIISVLSGIMAFVSTSIGGILLEFVQKREFYFLGGIVYGQHILNSISVLMYVGMLFYIQMVIKPVEEECRAIDT